MAESSGEGSSINYQKTVAAQNERTTNVEKPKGLIDTLWTDKLRGKWVSADVTSEYNKNWGGRVNSSIRTGRVALHQNWQFDQEGNVKSVSVVKHGPGSVEASRTVLERSDDGKFQIKEHKVDTGLKYWEAAFQTANKRLK